MNDLNELERHVSDQLQGIGRLAPDADGWDGIHRRLESRRRVRARARVAGVAVVLVAMVAVLIPLAGGGDRPTQVASDPQGFPRLVLDLPGYELMHADSSEDVAPRADIGRLFVYGDAGPGLLGTGEVVFVRLVPAGASYGIGETDSTVPVDVAGRPGRLFGYSSLTTSLGWPRTDGSLVHLVATGVPDDTLANMGRSVESALAEGLAPPTELGDGLALRRDGTLDTGPSEHGEVGYTGPENRTVDLRLTSGGPTDLDDLVLDRLASAGSWQPLTVEGQPAVASTYAGDPGLGAPTRAVMWAVRPGVVAELVTQGMSEAESEAALASITEIDEADWAALVARFRSAGEPASDSDPLPPPPAPETESPHAIFQSEMCKASYAWLQAVEVGDTGGRVTMTAELHSLRDKGEAAGLGNDGDIIQIADRLVAAADAGDVDAVRAERSMCP
jgi:hypothetical protein